MRARSRPQHPHPGARRGREQLVAGSRAAVGDDRDRRDLRRTIVRRREPQAAWDEDDRVRAATRLTWRDDRGRLAVADKRRESETAPLPLGARGRGVVDDAGAGAGEVRDEAVGRARSGRASGTSRGSAVCSAPGSLTSSHSPLPAPPRAPPP